MTRINISKNTHLKPKKVLKSSYLEHLDTDLGHSDRSMGSIMVGLVFMVGTFTIVIYALLLTISSQFDFTFRQVAFDQALNIAEAGLNYYRWHLAHAPEDYQDGTGTAGPYEHEYRDPQGDVVGKFSLEITPPEPGSSVVTIASSGTPKDYPGISRTILAQYGQSSLAKYSFLSDSSLWFGNGITITGPIHSNNGIRMDGTNVSTITSAKETYTCGIETGCWPQTKEKPGVWGNGELKELWDFPIPAISFEGFSVDFSVMRAAAKEEGIYLGPSDAAGYHLIFNADGTVAVNRVLTTTFERGYTPGEGCKNLYQNIISQEALATYSLADISVIFAEDILWVEGVVNGEVMVAAARFPLGTFETNIWINDNLTYLTKDGSHTLGLVAQHDIYFAYDIPREYEVNAAMMAQNGKIIRHHYNWRNCSNLPKAQRNQLTIYGTVISKEKSYWNFGSGAGQPASGFVKREITYDQSLQLEPPPYFPTSGDFELMSWIEE